MTQFLSFYSSLFQEIDELLAGVLTEDDEVAVLEELDQIIKVSNGVIKYLKSQSSEMINLL